MAQREGKSSKQLQVCSILASTGVRLGAKYYAGKRKVTQPGSRALEPMAVLLKKLLSSVSDALNAPICKTTVMIDVRSTYIRIEEVSVFDLRSVQGNLTDRDA